MFLKGSQLVDCSKLTGNFAGRLLYSKTFSRKDFFYVLLIFLRLSSIFEFKHNEAVFQKPGDLFQTRFGQSKR